MSLPWDVFGVDATWMLLMAFLVALPCSQIGSFLVLRRMSLVGDAISHGVLPGIVLGFVFTGDLASPWLLVGAAVSGILVTLLVELIHRKSKVKQDAAIGIAFTTLFALGVLMLEFFTHGSVHLDASCVIEGQLDRVIYYPDWILLGVAVPEPVVTMAALALCTMILIVVFYRALLMTSFDPGLSASFGFRPSWIHYGLVGFLSVIVVSAFQAVGAILVIALLILPAASAYLCTHRLKTMLVLAGVHAFLSSWLGLLLYAHLNAGLASAIVTAGMGLFLLAWLVGPVDGVLMKWLARQRAVAENQRDVTKNVSERNE